MKTALLARSTPPNPSLVSTFQRSLYQDFDVATPYGEDPEPTFRAGKVAMFQNGRWATPGVRTVEFNWDVVELPTRTQAAPLVTGCSGARMWSTPRPNIPKKPGLSSKL